MIEANIAAFVMGFLSIAALITRNIGLQHREDDIYPLITYILTAAAILAAVVLVVIIAR